MWPHEEYFFLAGDGAVRSGKAELGEFSGKHAALAGFGNVEGLGVAAEGFDEAARHGGGKAERVVRFFGIELQDRRGCSCGCDRAHRARRVPGAVVARVYRASESREHVVAEDDGLEKIGSARSNLFAERERHGHRDRARMADGRAVAVVEFADVTGDAVHERRALGGELRADADRGGFLGASLGDGKLSGNLHLRVVRARDGAAEPVEHAQASVRLEFLIDAAHVAVGDEFCESQLDRFVHLKSL